MQNTSTWLENLVQRTEWLLEKAVAEWQMLPIELLETAPRPDAWTAAQCLEHLNIYGRHYLPAIEKAIEKSRKMGCRPDAVMRSGWLGAWFTDLMLPQQGSAIKKKMQSPKNARPAARPDSRAVLAEFIDQQEKMLALLRLAAEANLNKIRVPTSLSPLVRLRLGDTFGFVVAHLERHVLQADRAITAARSDRQ